MKGIPETEEALVLRTDFSDDAAWESLCEAIQQPADVLGEYKELYIHEHGEFEIKAYVECLSDRGYEGLSIEKLRELIPDGYRHSFMFIVDGRAITDAEHPILVVDLYDEPGRTFRVIPSELFSVENNLSVANMDFAEFADAADEDGVFRGFE